MRILVVDDDFSSQEYLKAVLTSFGDVEISDNGMSAYELFCVAQEAGEPYDVIFMDVKMPLLDGYESTKRIRQWERVNLGTGRSVIVMATANVFKSDALESFKAGADLHLPKPYSPRQIEGFLKECGFFKRPKKVTVPSRDSAETALDIV